MIKSCIICGSLSEMRGTTKTCPGECRSKARQLYNNTPKRKKRLRELNATTYRKSVGGRPIKEYAPRKIKNLTCVDDNK